MCAAREAIHRRGAQARLRAGLVMCVEVHGNCVMAQLRCRARACDLLEASLSRCACDGGGIEKLKKRETTRTRTRPDHPDGQTPACTHQCAVFFSHFFEADMGNALNSVGEQVSSLGDVPGFKQVGQGASTVGNVLYAELIPHPVQRAWSGPAKKKMDD